MSDAFRVGGYWGPRPQPLEVCAERLAGFLADLAEADPLLSAWYEKGYSREQALRHRVDTSVHGIADRLAAGRQRHDNAARSVIPELGYSMDAWNGDDAAADISVLCGGVGVPGQVPNRVVVRLPDAHDAPALYRRDTAMRVLRSVVEHWRPDWATLVSRHLREQTRLGPGHVRVGWATYFASLRASELNGLPGDVGLEEVAAGVIVSLPGGPLDATPERIAAVQAVVGRGCDSRRRGSDVMHPRAGICHCCRAARDFGARRRAPGSELAVPSAGAYVYDAAGRLTTWTSPSGQRRSVTAYTPLGRPETVSVRQGPANSDTQVAHTTYAYWPDGSPAVTQANSGGGPKTNTVDAGSTTLTSTLNGSGVPGPTAASRSYTVAGAGVVAQRSHATGWVWLEPDAQGSVRAALKASTGDVRNTTYLPFGQPTSGGAADTVGALGYLGKVHPSTGTDIGQVNGSAGDGGSHAGAGSTPGDTVAADARDYASTLARFTTPDPLLDLAAQQSLNPYSYADNNPISGLDPTGLQNLACRTCGARTCARRTPSRRASSGTSWSPTASSPPTTRGT